TGDKSNYHGKILRINLDGTVPSDNPTLNGFKSHVYTYGHRNPQGIAFGSDGKLYSSEHGPKVDDELNIIESGKDYGYPLISGYFDDNYQYCNWAPSQICIDSPTGWKDTDNTCPAGVIPLSESDSYPSGPPANFMPPIGTYNSSKDSNGDDYDVSGGWLTWPTVAPSGIMIYEAGRIPCWEKSLIIPTLKRSTIYRVELNTTGDGLANQNYEEFHSTPKDRYRDIIVAPDGITFYAITDNSGGTSGPSGGANGGGSVDHKGVIVKIQYTGDVNWYADSDGDGYGDINTITVAAANAQPVGYVSDNTDCDDTPGSGSAINPDTIWYADTDGDGY